MLLDFQIAKNSQGKAVDFSIDVPMDNNLIEEKGYTFTSPCRLVGTLVYEFEALKLTANAEVSIKAFCDLCGEDLEKSFTFPIEEVFAKSKLDLSTHLINYPDKWFEHFTWAEKLGIAVFRERIAIEDYYNSKGEIKERAAKEICTDIDRGLWDSCFFWDIENYHSVTATSSLNTTIIKLLSNQNGLPSMLQQDKKNEIVS